MRAGEAMMEQRPESEINVVLTPQQAKSRKARNIAIGLAVGFMVVLFYVVTIAKLGGNILKQGM